MLSLRNENTTFRSIQNQNNSTQQILDYRLIALQQFNLLKINQSKVKD